MSSILAVVTVSYNTQSFFVRSFLMVKVLDTFTLNFYRALTDLNALNKTLELEKNDQERMKLNALKNIALAEVHEFSTKISEFTKPSHFSDSQTVFTPYNLQQLLEMPPKEWLVDQLFGPGDLGMIFGASGCGKTFVVIDLIMRMCTGTLWAQRFDVIRPLNVVYCAGEGNGAMPDRFKAAIKHHKISDLPNFTYHKQVPQIYSDKEGPDTILQFIGEYMKKQRSQNASQLDVLIIDTLHTAIIGADENSAKDMGKVIQYCKTASTALGCAVILIHHTNKGGEDERGSSSQRGAMDFMIRIKKKSEESTEAILHCAKLKDGEMWKDQSFLLMPVEDTNSVHVSWGEPIDYSLEKSCSYSRSELLTEMRKYPGKKFSCKSLAEIIGHKQNYTTKLLNQLVFQNQCKRILTDPDKDASSKNEWKFYVESF